MAEPTNTPMPPSTPVPASTPRSVSPAPPLPDLLTVAAAAARLGGSDGGGGGSSNGTGGANDTTGNKPRVLHIGDEVRYNPETYEAFAAQCTIVRPSTPERSRPAFVQALREGRWGDFSAIFRPFWGTGGEMGQWDEELITLLPDSVRVFASAGAGFDWADTKLLGEKGVIYCNSGLAASEAVADFAVAMIISTFRQLPWCMTAATSGNTSSFQACHAGANAGSHNLRGHTLGLVGLGNIGQQVASRCRHGFGMAIAYHDLERKPPSTERDLQATFHDSLPSLLAASDCVVLATPAMGGGKPLVDAETLALFRDGARFVNVARGSLVDEDALADALESGKLSAVALDVHRAEPDVHPRLLRFAGSRAMLSCHNAGGTVETHKGFEELSMRNIMAVLAGGSAITPVNLRYLKS